jgi:putative hydrolase of the HAD superfamily
VATWAIVTGLDDDGKRRWRGSEGDRGFWRSFVQTVFERVGGGTLPEEMFAELIAHFAAAGSWRLYDDVPEALAALRARGLKLVIVSNWDASLPRLLDALELTPHFDAVVVSSLVGASKPSREIFEAALKQAGVLPEEALHVGDSLRDDYHGARAAGLRALLLDRKGCAGEECEAIRSLSELPGRL